MNIAMETSPRLWVCGARGSFVATGADCDMFGRNTSCFALRSGGHGIIVDCGTGLSAAEAPLSGCERIDVLFTHFHFDHVMGVFSAPWLLRGAEDVHMWGYVPGSSLREALSGLARPPYWPVPMPLDNCTLHELSPGDSLTTFGDGTTVYTMEADHPNSGLLYRVTVQGKSVVFAFDREHGSTDRELADFAAGCDMLVYDGTFTPEEYEQCVGWGHSSYERGVSLMEASGAGRLLITHHAYNRTDAQLLAMERDAQRLSPLCAFAREGACCIL